MKIYIYKIVFLLLLFQLGFAQSNVPTKKNITKLLSESGQHLYDMECDKSLEVAKKALAEAHKSKDYTSMARAYNIIALNFQEFSDVKQSLAYYQKALYYANLSENDTVKNSVYNNLGSIYSYSIKDHERAIVFYNEALKYSLKIKDSIELTYTRLNIASAYFANRDFKKGKKYLDASENYVMNSNELEAKISLTSMYGSYYSHFNDNVKAEKYFKQALIYAKQNVSELVASSIVDIYHDFSMHYKKNKDYKNALFYMILHDSLQDKIYNDEKVKNVKVAGIGIELDEYKRQVNKIEGENQLQKKTLKESKLVAILFIVVFLILILLLVTFYKNLKYRENTNLELKNANKELQLAKEKADEASQLKTQFVSTITHELRTPLYGVIGITNILLDEHKELSNSPHLKSLKFSAKYLLSLVNDILQINKIEENRIVLEHLIFNLTDEITTIKNSLDFIANRTKNELTFEIDTAIPEFLIGDKLRLSQILMNLVSNALKFTKNGVVTIAAELDRTEGTMNYITFKVKDNGIGIAKENQEKIFEKFVQIERKEEDYQGTGLGLSIVKNLIALFESDITLVSDENIGTTFTFTIGFEYDQQKTRDIINKAHIPLMEYKLTLNVINKSKSNEFNRSE